jgi:hypothetical protein
MRLIAQANTNTLPVSRARPHTRISSRGSLSQRKNSGAAHADTILASEAYDSARQDLTWWLFQSRNLADERADGSAKKWALWQEISRCKTNPLGTRTRLIRSW